MSYRDTFIRIAPDSPRRDAVPPPAGKPTIARLQYELLASRPGELTERELHFQVHCLRNSIPAHEAESRRSEIEARLFAKPQACLRASPLPKTYGWGVHYDEQGAIRLVAAGSTEYETLANGGLKQLAAMRSSRV